MLHSDVVHLLAMLERIEVKADLLEKAFGIEVTFRQINPPLLSAS